MPYQLLPGRTKSPQPTIRNIIFSNDDLSTETNTTIIVAKQQLSKLHYEQQSLSMNIRLCDTSISTYITPNKDKKTYNFCVATNENTILISSFSIFPLPTVIPYWCFYNILYVTNNNNLCFGSNSFPVSIATYSCYYVLWRLN